MSKESLIENFFGGLPVIEGWDFKEAIEAFTRRGVAATTANTDRYRLTPLCHPQRPLGTIGVDDVDSYIAQLSDRLSDASVQTYKQTIKSFFKWCIDRGMLEGPSPAVHLKPKRKRSSRHKAANEEDLMRVIGGLMAESESGDPAVIRDLLLFRMAFESGNRLSELARLATRDVQHALRLPKLSTGGIAVYTAPSGAGKRGVLHLRFTEYTAAAYRLWEQVRPSPSPYVFVSLWGSRLGLPMTLGGFTAIFVRRCRQFDVPVYRTHAIRHLKGTRVSDRYSPRVAATVLNITVEMAIQHYYDPTDQTIIDATAI